MSGFTPHGEEWATAQAMLLGLEVREVNLPDSPPGFRWNSGTLLGQWTPTKAQAVILFLSAKGYFVTVDGELERI